MSIRPDRVKEEATRFSLEDFMGAETRSKVASSALPKSALETQKLSPHILTPVSSNDEVGKINFKLPNMQAQPLHSTNNRETSQQLLQLTLNLPSIQGLGDKRAANAYTTTPSQDVMRLAALLEDSKTALAKMTARLSSTEESVARANQSLITERAAHAARVVQLTNELRASREGEARIRAELATSPNKVELERQQTAFRIQAEGALQLESAYSDLKRQYNELISLHNDVNNALTSLRAEHASLEQVHSKVTTELAEATSRLHETSASEPETNTTEKASTTTNAETVERVRAELQAAYAAKMAAIEKSKTSLEELLLEAAETQKAITESRDNAIKEAADIRAQLEAEKKLPQEVENLLDTYSNLYCQLENLEAKERDDIDHQLDVAATRNAVESLSKCLVQSSGLKAPPVIKQVPDHTLSRSLESPIGATLCRRSVPLDAAVAHHRLHTGHLLEEVVTIYPTKCSGYDSSSEDENDSESDPDGATTTSVVNTDLKTKEGRLNAAIKQMSADLKGLFAIKKKRYQHNAASSN